MTEAESARPEASEILGRVLHNAENELDRAPSGLAFSGVAAGLTMGLSGMSVAVLQHHLPATPWAHALAFTLYPLGFIAVIIGRAQLFTENTLYPVVLVLDRRERYLDTLRLWVIVFCANIVGVLVFAVLMTKVHTIRRPTQETLVDLGHRAVGDQFGHVFWTAVVGGWLVALIAWLVEAAESSIGQIFLVWLLAYVVGLGAFAHCVATSGEIMTAVLDGAVSGGNYVRWLVAATLGNIAGGVIIVALLNYGQVMAGTGEERPSA